VVAVEKDVFRFQVVVTRDHVRIVTRVNACHACVLSEEFLGFTQRQNLCSLELSNESIHGIEVIHHSRERERRQSVQPLKGDGNRTRASVAGNGLVSTKAVIETRFSVLVYQTRGAIPASAPVSYRQSGVFDRLGQGRRWHPY
jgi:hypothetical protein